MQWAGRPPRMCVSRVQSPTLPSPPAQSNPQRLAGCDPKTNTETARWDSASGCFSLERADAVPSSISHGVQGAPSPPLLPRLAPGFSCAQEQAQSRVTHTSGRRYSIKTSEILRTSEQFVQKAGGGWRRPGVRTRLCVQAPQLPVTARPLNRHPPPDVQPQCKDGTVRPADAPRRREAPGRRGRPRVGQEQRKGALPAPEQSRPGSTLGSTVPRRSSHPAGPVRGGPAQASAVVF